MAGSVTDQLKFDANLSRLYTEAPLEERFDLAARDGFGAVEIGQVYELPLATLRARLADAGLIPVLINTPSGEPGSPTARGAACVPDAVEFFRSGLLRSLEYATGLGAGLIHLMAGICPAGVTSDYAFSTYLANVAWAAEQAASAGVTLVLEAINQRDEPGFILKSIDQAADVVRALGHENVRLLFDVYHCQAGSGDLGVRLERLMPLTGHIQIADPPHRGEPGTGEIRWGFVFDRIRLLGYEGWVGLEYDPVAGTSAGLAWLKDLALLPLPRPSAAGG